MDITVTAAIAVLVGLASTILTAIVKQPGWPREKKRRAALIIAGGLGLLSAITTGAIAPPAAVSWPWWEIGVYWLTWIVCVVAVVITVSSGIYQQLEGPLNALTERTSRIVEGEVADQPAAPSYQPERAEVEHPPAELVPDAEHATPDAIAKLQQWHDQHGRE